MFNTVFPFANIFILLIFSIKLKIISHIYIKEIIKILVEVFDSLFSFFMNE